MHKLNYLQDILILLCASFVIVVFFKQLKLSPALGYLVAGAAIGPFGFGMLSSGEATKSIAELGIVFLLFAIGLELTLEKLFAMKKYVVGFGGLQVVLTTTAISWICYEYLQFTPETSVIIGSALALSSTAIVLQVISEAGDENTRVGRLSFSVLLMQDLAVIPILVLLPIITKNHSNILGVLGMVTIKGIVAMFGIFIAGRLFIRPFYRLIADSKNDVLFLSLTLIVICASAFTSNKLGLSSALGAFIAGLMVAETEYKYRVEEEILSLKSLLMGLFFMSIGMSFDFDLLLKSLPFVMTATLALIIIKAVIIIALCACFRFPFAPAIHTGLLLAQGGEFAFVVFVMATEKRIIDTDLAQFLMTVVTFSMALTPLLAIIGKTIKNKLYVAEVLNSEKIRREIADLNGHIIVVGFGKMGKMLSHILRRSGLSYIIIDNNHRAVKIAKANGYNISYGDATNLEILNYISITKAEAIIVAMDDEISCIKITRFLRQNFENLNIISKVENANNADRFIKIGASSIVSKSIETAIRLAKVAMAVKGFSTQEVEAITDNFRNIDSDNLKIIIGNQENRDQQAE